MTIPMSEAVKYNRRRKRMKQEHRNRCLAAVAGALFDLEVS